MPLPPIPGSEPLPPGLLPLPLWPPLLFPLLPLLPPLLPDDEEPPFPAGLLLTAGAGVGTSFQIRILASDVKQ